MPRAPVIRPKVLGGRREVARLPVVQNHIAAGLITAAGPAVCIALSDSQGLHVSAVNTPDFCQLPKTARSVPTDQARELVVLLSVGLVVGADIRPTKIYCLALGVVQIEREVPGEPLAQRGLQGIEIGAF